MKKTKDTPNAFIYMKCFGNDQGSWTKAAVEIEGQHGQLVELLANALDQDLFGRLIKEAIVLRTMEKLEEMQLMGSKKAKA